MITLNTILYEGNFNEILSPDSWFFTIKSDLITNKLLTINNITSIRLFSEKLANMKKQHNFDVVYVLENKDNAIKEFNLNIDETTVGYYYTIAYFVAIINTKTEFLLNVASDCMQDININDEFFRLSIKEIDNNEFCSTTMVAWTKNNYIMANGLTIGQYEHDETFKKLNREYVISEWFNYTANFTDQFFMGSIDKLKKIDYNISESYSNQIYNGPTYGGNCFEKRMVAHQVQNNRYNCVFKGNQYYIHDGKYY